MIAALFAGYLTDALRANQASWLKDIKSLARPSGRQAALRAPVPSSAVSDFIKVLAEDGVLWSSQPLAKSAKPTGAYALVRDTILRNDALTFRRRAKLQRAAAQLLRKGGIAVPEVQVATSVDLEANGPVIVSVRRALLGGVRLLSSGALQDRSWQSALRKLFSV